MNDWSQFKVRCSAINKIMANSKENAPLTDLQVKELDELDKKPNRTEKQSIRLTELVQKREKSAIVVLSDTCVAYLLEAYAWETEKMCSITKEMDVEYFERGRKTEPESIELLREVDNKSYVKNDMRFDNDFLSGIPDVVEPDKEMRAASSIQDIKSCKDYPTFLYKIHKGLDPGNKEQLQGYGDILECGDLRVVFTLPTMPQSIREGYKYRLAQKMEEVTIESPKFKKAWAELEHSMIFDHIDARKRVYKIPIEPFTKIEQIAVYDRVKVCREWLCNFDIIYKNLNK